MLESRSMGMYCTDPCQTVACFQSLLPQTKQKEHNRNVNWLEFDLMGVYWSFFGMSSKLIQSHSTNNNNDRPPVSDPKSPDCRVEHYKSIIMIIKVAPETKTAEIRSSLWWHTFHCFFPLTFLHFQFFSHTQQNLFKWINSNSTQMCNKKLVWVSSESGSMIKHFVSINQNATDRSGLSMPIN